MTDPVKEELRATLIAAEAVLRDGARWLEEASLIKSDSSYLEDMATVIRRTLDRVSPSWPEFEERVRPDVTGRQYLYDPEACPGHVASEDPKVCTRCGTHIDELRPPA